MSNSRSARITVDAPVAAVWDTLSDLSRMPEWSPELEGVRWLDGADRPQPGARFKGTNRRRRGWTTTCTVTEAEPGRVLAFAVGRGETVWRYELDAPTPDGPTVVTESFEIAKMPGAVGRWMTKVAVGVPWDRRLDDLEDGMRTTLAGLARAVGS